MQRTLQRRSRRVFLAFAISVLCGTVSAHEAMPLSNGDMEADANGDQWPDDWPQGAGLFWRAEDGHYLPRDERGPVRSIRH
mgnify:CR=1 FL=1